MPTSLFDLKGRTALVTGGSKGLGEAMARALALAGADVVITARHPEELQSALARILEGTGARGAWVVADLADRDNPPVAHPDIHLRGSAGQMHAAAGELEIDVHALHLFRLACPPPTCSA